MQGNRLSGPRPTLGVGVTGHRAVRMDPEMIASLAPALDAVTSALRDAADRYLEHRRGELWLHTALATGADQAAAESGRRSGFCVRAVLPFAVEEYRDDFAAGPERDEFERQLAAADAVLALPGLRENGDDGYVMAGEAIVSSSDLMIAVWDGNEEALGPGGTAHVVDLAFRAGVPVVHVLVDRAAGRIGPVALRNGRECKPLRAPADYDALLRDAPTIRG